MPFLRSLNQYADLYKFTFRHVFSFGVWWPLLVFATLSVLALIGLSFYTHPALYSVLNPYLQMMGRITTNLGISPDYSTHFSHYPTHFRLLASQFEWVKLPLALLFEGLAITLTARAFMRRRLKQSGGSVGAGSMPEMKLGLWFKIIIVWLSVYLLISVVAYSLPNLFGDWLYGSPRRAQIFDLGLFTLSNILIAPFIFAFPILGIGSGSVSATPSLRDAFLQSLRLFGKYPMTSLFLVLLPSFIFVYPLTWAVSPASGFAIKLQPELMVYLIIGLIVGNMIVNFLYAGAATKLILDERQ